MNKMLKRVAGFACAFVFAALLFLNNLSVHAEGESGAPQLYLLGYEVTNEAITPGAEFTLTLHIHNFSKNVDAYDVGVLVGNPDGVVPKYGTVSMVYVGKIAAGETIDVEFDYTANADIKYTDLNFSVAIGNGLGSTSVMVRIPVGNSMAVVAEEYDVPLLYTVGKVQYISALIENVSSKGVSDVRLILRNEEEEVASAFVGTLAAGTMKTQYVSVQFAEAGEVPVELVLNYTGEDGSTKEYVICYGVVTVEEDTPASAPEGNGTPGETGTGNSRNGNVIIICVTGVLLIVLCCVILMMLYRRK